MTDKKPTEVAQPEPSQNGQQPKKESSATAKTPSSSKAPNSTASTRTSSPTRASKMPLLALVISIVAIAGAAWIWWQLQELTSQQQAFASTQQLDARSNELNAMLQTLNSKASSLQKDLSEQKHIGEERQQRILQISQQMKTLTDSRPSDWMLAEANYLVTLAARRLWLEHDASTTIVLLQAADQRIKEMNDPGLINLRQALADDINQLRALPDIDKEGMALQLNSLQRQISELPLSSVILPEVVDAEIQEQLSDDPSEWADNLLKSWASLMDGFITVRKRSGSVEPLLAPEQRWFLVENLRTKLLQAQLALYREQQDAWHDSLGQALAWSENFFDTSSPATQSVLKQLSELSQQPITADYPSDLFIRSLLQDELAERASARLTNKPTNQAVTVQPEGARAELDQADITEEPIKSQQSEIERISPEEQPADQMPAPKPSTPEVAEPQQEEQQI